MNKAYIIGTGPGDEELLTLKAVNVLKKCDAVLYDRLVSNNVLNYLNDDCEVYYCGKEPGCHYKTQEEINEMLVKLALEGKVVGRIKGGDPYVFGRGGEEVLALKENNIEFEVVPGVTSPISVLNYAGIPITHRGISQSFHIVTGMSAGKVNTNWEALSKENGTLVFMMGLENLSLIVENLLLNGKDEKTPSAVIMKGTTAKQKKVVGTLENIVEKVKEAKLKSPCIIVVGDVVNLNDDLSWYDKKPLFGVNICTTRSKKQSASIKEKLKELGAEVTEINSIEIEETSENLNDYKERLETYDHIIFTSVNGVNIFFDYLRKEEIDLRNLKAKISVIGRATKTALADRGIFPFVMAREFVGEGLVEMLLPKVKEGEKVLIPCSSSSRSILQEELTNKGLIVDKVNIYNTICGKVKNKKAFEEVDMVFYTSPSTVKNMVTLLGEEKLKEKYSVAIGPQTYKALKAIGIDSYMCKKHHESGFINEVVEMVNNLDK